MQPFSTEPSLWEKDFHRKQKLPTFADWSSGLLADTLVHFRLKVRVVTLKGKEKWRNNGILGWWNMGATCAQELQITSNKRYSLLNLAMTDIWYATLGCSQSECIRLRFRHYSFRTFPPLKTQRRNTTRPSWLKTTGQLKLIFRHGSEVPAIGEK